MSVIGRESKEKITELFERHVSSGKVEFFRNAGIDFVLGKREGIHMYDLDGSRYINCNCNGGVFNLGTPPPRDRRGHCGKRSRSSTSARTTR